jgi:hypothetical protein
MTPEELAAAEERDRKTWPYPAPPFHLSQVEGFSAILDRRALLAEVKRLRGVMFAQRAVIEAYTPRDLHGQIERLQVEKHDLTERLSQMGCLNHEPAASTAVGTRLALGADVTSRKVSRTRGASLSCSS